MNLRIRTLLISLAFVPIGAMLAWGWMSLIEEQNGPMDYANGTSSPLDSLLTNDSKTLAFDGDDSRSHTWVVGTYLPQKEFIAKLGPIGIFHGHWIIASVTHLGKRIESRDIPSPIEEDDLYLIKLKEGSQKE
ncbi:MAG TPA: hypothetical protein VGL56_05305 [Fimbriimonadaceae bacterium]|jgi:hypothetical protein